MTVSVPSLDGDTANVMCQALARMLRKQSHEDGVDRWLEEHRAGPHPLKPRAPPPQRLLLREETLAS